MWGRIDDHRSILLSFDCEECVGDKERSDVDVDVVRAKGPLAAFLICDDIKEGNTFMTYMNQVRTKTVD